MKKLIPSTIIFSFLLSGTAFAQVPTSTTTTIPVENPTSTSSTIPIATSSASLGKQISQINKTAEQQISALRKEMEAKIKVIRSDYEARIKAIRDAAKAQTSALSRQGKDAIKKAETERLKKELEQKKKNSGGMLYWLFHRI